MTDYAIQVKNLRKVFKQYKRPEDFLYETLFWFKRHTPVTALDGISFDIKPGEVVGILGRNGAGKSSLLKILASKLNTTSGEVSINGKVSCILELGTGFNRNYTGRENIYMGGMCLGMTRDEIDAKLDSIIEFCELGSMIDMPFHTYSSGMRARLTFSVAISVDPDILIIDEALAAGDNAFVSKCLTRIVEICRSGKTVLFVTHNTDHVRRLCDRCIYLDNGKIKIDGDANKVSAIYDIDVLDSTSEHLSEHAHGAKASIGPAVIEDIQILNADHTPKFAFFQHEKILIDLLISSTEVVKNPVVSITITRSDGIIATAWLSDDNHVTITDLQPGKNRICLAIDDIELGEGHFELSVAIYPARKNDIDTLFYDDPMSIWERTHKILIKRKHRRIASIYDQKIRIASQESVAQENKETEILL